MNKKTVISFTLLASLSISAIAMENVQKYPISKNQAKLDSKLINLLFKYTSSKTDIDSVEKLLKEGANPNALYHDHTLFYYFAGSKIEPKSLCELLLKYGANPALIDKKSGKSTLINAAFSGDYENCKIIVEHEKTKSITTKSILTLLLCLKKMSKYNPAANLLYKHSNELLKKHLQGQDLLSKLLHIKDYEGRTAYDHLPFSWLKPE